MGGPAELAGQNLGRIGVPASWVKRSVMPFRSHARSVTKPETRPGTTGDRPAGTSGERRAYQQIVVRSAGGEAWRGDWGLLPADATSGWRDPMPTLTGLGDEPLGASATPSMVARWRELPSADSDLDDADEPQFRAPDRSRPETLTVDLDDELARSYLEQAERILASGIFSSPDLAG